MTKGTTIGLLALGISVVIAGIVMIVVAQKAKLMTAFEFVIKQGATKSNTPNVGDRYDYGNYGFYSNNRVVEFSTGKKGGYTKERILFDDGTSILLVDIFK